MSNYVSSSSAAADICSPLLRANWGASHEPRVESADPGMHRSTMSSIDAIAIISLEAYTFSDLAITHRLRIHCERLYGAGWRMSKCQNYRRTK